MKFCTAVLLVVMGLGFFADSIQGDDTTTEKVTEKVPEKVTEKVPEKVTEGPGKESGQPEKIEKKSEGQENSGKDPPCTSVGHFKSVIPGKFYKCRYDQKNGRWLSYMQNCEPGMSYYNEKKACH